MDILLGETCDWNDQVISSDDEFPTKLSCDDYNTGSAGVLVCYGNCNVIDNLGCWP